MRVFTSCISLTFALFTQVSFASSNNCVTINSDLAAMKVLASTGQYRKLPKITKVQTFDYNNKRSYDEYLTFAQAKVNTENPKASLKCPIETGVTQALNLNKNELTVANLVSPFELKAKTNSSAITQGILLIHGLTDSPYLLHDLAAFYHSQGLSVRTLLLPGHGTAPQALIDIKHQEWQQATEYAINKMSDDFGQVYLGGFSTGGALILDNLLSQSATQEKVKGVILWAPASKAKSSVAWAAQIVDWIPFLDYAHKGADIDFAKYESFPFNAGAQVHVLMNQLTKKLNGSVKIPDIPLLTVTSEVDATIDTKATLNLLNKWHTANNRTTNKLDTLFYFGAPASLSALAKTFNRVLPSCNDKSYCQSIVDVAHTAVTNAPSNPHYGWQGNYRNCETAFATEHYQVCKTTEMVKLGETTEKNLAANPSLQRLTFNPNFKQMTNELSNFISKTQ